VITKVKQWKKQPANRTEVRPLDRYLFAPCPAQGSCRRRAYTRLLCVPSPGGWESAGKQRPLDQHAGKCSRFAACIETQGNCHVAGPGREPMSKQERPQVQPGCTAGGRARAILVHNSQPCATGLHNSRPEPSCGTACKGSQELVSDAPRPIRPGATCRSRKLRPRPCTCDQSTKAAAPHLEGICACLPTTG
jgi:hypothetical protein